MKIVFFGTSSFGLPSLEALKSSPHEITSVVTTLDKPQGRSLKLKASPVKDWAQKNNIPYLEISKKNIVDLSRLLRELHADLFVVISFGLILPKALLDTPKLMALNVHASLLPKYRGAAPMHWAMMNGDSETGVAVMRMTETLDTGDILLQMKSELGPAEDILSLENRLGALGAKALLESIEQLENKKAVFTPQERSRSSYARKITKEDGHIQWGRPSAEIFNWFRALKAWPKSYSFYAGKRLIILSMDILTEENNKKFAAGTIVSAVPERGILIASADRLIKVDRLQLEGKKPLEAVEFLKGFSIKAGQILE